MLELFEKKTECFGCEACVAVCPQKVIVMKRDGEGFAYPAIEEERCIDCGMCEEICPHKHPLLAVEPRAYAVRCNDIDVLYRSTSGGAFSLIASCILREGGLVCGAVFDDDFQVVHVLSDDIHPMRKAKYVQSSIGNCFLEMEETLKAGREVLFSGTPCQCHGVKRLFGKHPGLLLVSIICRGVQSPALWEEYRRWLEKDGVLSAFCFRDKRRLNDAHTVSWTVGGEENEALYQKDPFCRFFAKELSLRPACYHCPYCRPEKDFDFTIGDFWGIEQFLPELADGKGTSLVLAGSESARRIMEEIRTSARVWEAEPEQYMQESLRAPAKEPFLRKFFYKDFQQKGADGVCNMELLLKKYGS